MAFVFNDFWLLTTQQLRHVLYIHFRVLWDKSNTVEIGNKTLKSWGVGRTVKNRALYAFERAGLISIEWRGSKSPHVTLRADLSMLERNGSGTGA
jgi:hypothetical protein